MIKPKKKWVLVADGAKARIFMARPHELTEALDHDFVAPHIKPSERGSSKPGRSFESANPTRHAYEPRTDWRQHQKELFAQELCKVLEEHDEKKEIDELILIAPPKTLGDLRDHLSKHLFDKVTAEIPKDVTKFTETELLHFLEREV